MRGLRCAGGVTNEPIVWVEVTDLDIWASKTRFVAPLIISLSGSS